MKARGLILAAVMVVGACSDTGAYEAAIDALPVPPTWEAQKTVAGVGMSFCLNCPHVDRYYLSQGEMPAVLKEAEQAIRQAGYTDVAVSDPNCDRNTNGALCSITARSDQVLVNVNVYRPGDDVDHLGLARAGMPMVRITAQPS